MRINYYLSNEGKPEQPYNLWTSPPSEWSSEFAQIEVTPEIERMLRETKSQLPSEKKLEELTKPFNVPLSPHTPFVIVN